MKIFQAFASGLKTIKYMVVLMMLSCAIMPNSASGAVLPTPGAIMSQLPGWPNALFTVTGTGKPNAGWSYQWYRTSITPIATPDNVGDTYNFIISPTATFFDSVYVILDSSGIQSTKTKVRVYTNIPTFGQAAPTPEELKRNLLLWLPFNNDVRDSVSNTLYFGQNGFTTDINRCFRKNFAAKSTSDNQYVPINFNYGTLTTNRLGFSGYFIEKQTPVSEAILFSGITVANPNANFEVGITAAHAIRITIGKAGGNVTFTTLPNLFTTDAWQLLAVNIGSDNVLHIYLNGQEVFTQTGVTYTSAAGDFYVNSKGTSIGTLGLNGFLDELKLYSQELTADQLQVVTYNDCELSIAPTGYATTGNVCPNKQKDIYMYHSIPGITYQLIDSTNADASTNGVQVAGPTGFVQFLTGFVSNFRKYNLLATLPGMYTPPAVRRLDGNLLFVPYDVPTPLVSPGNTDLCSTPTGSVTLSVTNAPAGSTINWTGGVTGPTYTVFSAKTVKATYTTLEGCISDSSVAVVITSVGAPAKPVIMATSLYACAGASINISATTNPSNATYLWNTGATTPTLNVTKTGYYYLRVSTTGSNCYSDSSNKLFITIRPKPNNEYQTPILNDSTKLNQASFYAFDNNLLDSTNLPSVATLTGTTEYVKDGCNIPNKALALDGPDNSAIITSGTINGPSFTIYLKNKMHKPRQGKRVVVLSTINRQSTTPNKGFELSFDTSANYTLRWFTLAGVEDSIVQSIGYDTLFFKSIFIEFSPTDALLGVDQAFSQKGLGTPLASSNTNLILASAPTSTNGNPPFMAGTGAKMDLEEIRLYNTTLSLRRRQMLLKNRCTLVLASPLFVCQGDLAYFNVINPEDSVNYFVVDSLDAVNNNLVVAPGIIGTSAPGVSYDFQILPWERTRTVYVYAYYTNGAPGCTTQILRPNNVNNKIRIEYAPLPQTGFARTGGPSGQCQSPTNIYTFKYDTTGKFPKVSSSTYIITQPNKPDSIVAASQLSIKAAGTYSVVLKVVSTRGCTKTSAPPDTFSILPTAGPANLVLTGSNSVCQGDTSIITITPFSSLYKATWFKGGIAIPGETGQKLKVTAVGTYTAQLQYISNGTCKGPISNSVSITVNPLTSPSDFTGYGSVCSGSDVTLSAVVTGLAQYRWVVNNIVSATTTSVFVLNNVTVATTVDLQVANASGCFSTVVSHNITVTPAATQATITGPDTICNSASFTLTASGFLPSATNFKWFLNGGLVSTTTVPTFTTSTGGNYTVVTSTGSICISPISPAFTVTERATIPTPTITASPSASVCAGTTVTLTANPQSVNYTPIWLLNGSVIPGQNNYTFAVIAAGNYTVKYQSGTAGNCTGGTSGATVVTLNTPITPSDFTGFGAYCIGATVTLNANTTGLSNYKWVVNGVTSTVNNAQLVLFNVTVPTTIDLAVADGSGCYSTVVSHNISLTATPSQPTITGVDTVCNGGSYTLTATGFSAGSVQFQWFRNGVLVATTTVPTYTTSGSGNFIVAALLNANCSSSPSSPHTVSENVAIGSPTITKTNTPPYCQAPGAKFGSNFGTNPSITFLWIDSLYSNGSIVTSFGYTYTTTVLGKHKLRLVANRGLCPSFTSSADTFTIFRKPTPQIQALTPTSVCIPVPVRLLSQIERKAQGYSIQWLRNNVVTGNVGDTLTLTNPASSGIYKLQVTGVAGCTTISDSVIVTIKMLPLASILNYQPQIQVCEGSTVTFLADTGAKRDVSYTWYVNNTVIPNGNKPKLTTIAQPGVYRVDVSNGICTLRSKGTDMVIRPQPTAIIRNGIADTICRGNNLTLTALTSLTNPSKYQWQLNATNILGETTETLVINKAGNYRVIVESVQGGCKDTSLFCVVTTIRRVSPSFKFFGFDSTSYCSKSSAYFMADSVGKGITYQWVLNQTPIIGATNRRYYLNQGGNYRLIITTANKCDSSTFTSRSIVIKQAPEVDLGKDTTICELLPITLKGTTGGNYNYLWQDGSTDSTFSAALSGMYILRVTAANGCKVSDTVIIKTTECEPQMYCANAFTPNNDNQNEVFKLYAYNVSKFNFKVYDRWGEQVFISEDINKNWDGTFRSVDCPAGDYRYTLEYQGTFFGKAVSKAKTGTITIIR